MKKININSIEDMKNLGIKIGKSLRGGETICLTGDLGAGKTHLTQFIGEGMGIEDYITSPTFALLNIYDGKINLNHFDAYRLDGEEEFSELGFEEYLFSDDVNIIEWPEIVYNFLHEEPLNISIEKGEGEKRIVTIDTKNTEKYKFLLESISNESIGYWYVY